MFCTKISENLVLAGENCDRHRMSVTDTETPNSRHFVGKKNMHFHGQFSFKNLCSWTKSILWKPGDGVSQEAGARVRGDRLARQQEDPRPPRHAALTQHGPQALIHT